MLPPPAVNVPVLLLQIVTVLAVILGFAKTVTEAVTTLVQPCALEPVTLYTALDRGETVIVGLTPPGDQVYEIPPDAVKVMELP